jgi:hypothetical protein
MSEDPSREIAISILKVLSEKSDVDTVVILSAVSMVLSTIAVEVGLDEEKAVYAFRKSYGNAQRRLKRMIKEVH